MRESTLGHRVWLQRREWRWTQEELAHRARLGRNTISRLEQGSIQQLKSNAVVQLARALDVSADYLLGLSNDPDYTLVRE
jgi:transcriptional regulator with XRE-family HTH domain